MKSIRGIAVLLSAVLAIIASGHAILLMSDGPAYRRWVYIQMGLLVAGALLAWNLPRSRSWPVIGLALLTPPMTYINAVHLNYGNGAAAFVVPVLFWCVLGAALWTQRGEPGHVNRAGDA